jgi:hypothetical protein
MTLTVDQITSDLAVLEYEGGGVTVPSKLLPEGVKEGSILRFVLDESEEERIRRKAEKLLERLKSKDPGDDEMEL